MSTATISIVKTKGEYTGRVKERFFVRIDDREEFEVHYGSDWGFEFEGKRYNFCSNLNGSVTLISPDGLKPIKVAAKGIRINLTTWTKE